MAEEAQEGRCEGSGHSEKACGEASGFAQHVEEDFPLFI